MRSKFKWIFTLLMALTMQFSFAQEKTITGVVSDASGPLPGANVVIKGTSKGVSTGFDGKYSIKAKEGDVLVYSFMGNSISKTVGSSNVINTIIQDGPKALETVVVTAVGIKKRQDAITSSNQVVKAKELTQASSPNVLQSLAGKVSGVQINNTSGGVNGTNTITIRGNRSLSGNNQALIVVDNAISSVAFLSQLPPDIIESVNVIKGAQGAALYGEDGVNGVVVVTTKKGVKGEKMSVALSSSLDFQEVSFIAERQTRYGQGWSGTHVSYENGAWGAEMDGSIVPVGMQQANGQFIYAPYSPIKDNIKKFFNTGTLLQNGVSLSSGTLENGYFNFSYNRQQNDFVVKNDVLKRNSFTFKAGKKIGKFTIDGGVNYISDNSSYTTQRLLRELYQAATNIPIELFENSGNDGAWTSYYNNPYWKRENMRFDNNSDFINANTLLKFDFNKNISLSYNGNVRLRQVNDSFHNNGFVDKIKVGGGDHTMTSQFDQSNSNDFKYYSDLMLNFDYKLTEDLGFKLNLGQNLQDNYYKITSQGGNGLVIPGFYNMANITGTPRFDTNYVQAGNANNPTGAYANEKFGLANGTVRSRKMGLFANLDLSYKEFLFLNATARNDWSSPLSNATVKSYFYPSVGVSFVPTKLEALKDNKILNYSKLALSYTKVGNSSQITPYILSDRYLLGTGYPFGNNSSFVQSTRLVDPGITPEFVTTYEFDANFGFFGDRITLDGAFYKGTTDNLITNATTSSATGGVSILRNVGKLTTKGMEIELGFTPIKTPNFKWENRVAYSTYKTMVDSIGDTNELQLQDDGQAGIYAVVGEEFPVIKGTAYERDPLGRVIVDAATGNPVRNAKYQILGKSTPDYIINFNTAVEYKGLRLAAVMDFRTGHQFYSQTKQWLSWSGHLYESAINGRTGFIYPNSVIETSPGVYTPNTSVVTGGNSYNSFLSYFQDEYAGISENFVLDATALKVRELSLSYSLPTKFIEKAGLSSLKIGVNARNPFVFLAKENRGYSDPETSNVSDGDTARINNNAVGLSPLGKYPSTRTYGFSVNLTF